MKQHLLHLLVLVASLSTFVVVIEAANNGLGLTPPMGWNTWCTQGPCSRDYCWEDEIKEVADAMSTNGMLEAGYQYVNLDDCWAGYRDAKGNLQPDSWRFPSGMKALADYVHSKGLKIGLYTDAGTATCVGNRPGSYGHYQQDANTFAAWGIDYVKMDWCNTYINGTQLDPREAYQNMSKALNNTGRKIFFNICEWGLNQPWKWGAYYGNSWRTGQDHHDKWDGNTNFIIAANSNLAPFAGPGGWNDMDFLMTGGEGCWWDFYRVCPGMTETEYITEFSMWSLLNSPLIVATDVRGSHFTAFKKSVLLNKEVIAVNQDKLGVQGSRLYFDTCPLAPFTCEVWGKPMYDKSWAVVLYNSGDVHSLNITLKFSSLGFPPSSKVLLRDLWQHKDVGTFQQTFTAAVAPHAVRMLRATLTK
jgi:alpha-galactosidase